MRRKFPLFAMLGGLVAFPIMPHEGGVHVKGTVSAVTEQHITVKDTAGRESEIKLTEQTQFLRGGAPVARSDLRQGERVIVHARKEGASLEATEVRVGTAGRKGK
jgi:hypothetical protein